MKLRPEFCPRPARGPHIVRGIDASRSRGPVRLGRVSAALAAAALTFAGTSATAAEGKAWSTDFGAAQEQAATQNKDLLLDFTGSDWCPPCQALDQNVFSTPTFLEEAPQHFVLVKLDFPQSVPQTAEVKQQNAELAERYQIGGAFPTTIFADAEGKPYALTTGYGGLDAATYLDQLETFRETKAQRDRALARAKHADGQSRAELLHQAMQAIGLELAMKFYPETVQEIQFLDSDGSLGLRAQYEEATRQQQLQQELRNAVGMLQSGQTQPGLQAIEQVLNQNPQPDTRQMALTVQGQVEAQLGQFDQSLATMDRAIDVLPDSTLADQIRLLQERLRTIKESQANPAGTAPGAGESGD